MSPISLNEKPATVNDVGITVYYSRFCGDLLLTSEHKIDYVDKMVHFSDGFGVGIKSPTMARLFWDKPVIISEDEYIELKQRISKLEFMVNNGLGYEDLKDDKNALHQDH